MKGFQWSLGKVAGGYLFALFATVGLMFRWPFHWVLMGLLYTLLILFFSVSMVVLGLTYILIFARVGSRLRLWWQEPTWWHGARRLGTAPTLATASLADLIPLRLRWVAKSGPRQAPLWDRWLDGH